MKSARQTQSPVSFPVTLVILMFKMTSEIEHSSPLTRTLKNRYEWRPNARLGKGSFGEVFRGRDIQSDKEVAIKMERKASQRSSCLKDEFERYFLLNTHVTTENGHLFGLPRIFDYFETSEYNVMVMELLGPDLDTLFKKCNKSFSVKTVCYIGIQLLHRIETIHSAKLIHRDIKPQNFVIGGLSDRKPHRDVIRIIDFGLAKTFTTDGKHHIKMKTGKSLVGTARYVSIRTHEGIDQSRRDDMESIGHLLMYFLLGEDLPWHRPPSDIEGNTSREKAVATYQWIGRKKKECPLDVLCQGMPLEFKTFMHHVRHGLEFHERPKYQYLRQLLETCFVNQGFDNDDRYDWDDLPELQVIQETCHDQQIQ